MRSLAWKPPVRDGCVAPAGSPSSPAAGAPGAQQSSGSSGVSSGAAAGIGIGCAVAGILIGAVAMMWVGRRRGWKRHNDVPVIANGNQGPSDAYKL